MGSYQEGLNRTKAFLTDLKISFFNATESIAPYAQKVLSAISATGELARSVNALYIVSSALWPKIKLSAIWLRRKNRVLKISSIRTGIATFFTKLFKRELISVNKRLMMTTIGITVFNKVTGSIRGAMLRATTGVRAFSIAIMNIPVVGWIIAIVTALIALFAYLYNNSKGFREMLGYLGGAIKAIFKNIGIVISNIWEQWIKPIFSKIGSLFTSIFGGIWDFFKWVWGSISSAFTWIWESVISPVAGFIGDVFIDVFTTIFDVASSLFGGLMEVFKAVWDWLVDIFGGFAQWFYDKVIGPIVGFFGDIWDSITSIFSSEEFSAVHEAGKEGAKKAGEKYDKEKAAEKDSEAIVPKIELQIAKAEKEDDHKSIFDVNKAGTVPTTNNIGGAAAQSVTREKTSKVVGNLSINKLVENMNFYSQDGNFDRETIKQMITEVLYTAAADASLAT